MSYDDKTDYHCFYEGCGYRGTQNQLDNHIQKECDFRVISCRYCHMYYRAMEEEDHVISCLQRFGCEYCEKRVAFCEKRHHYSMEHAVRECRYCTKWIEIDKLNQHYETCPERPRECIYCKKEVSTHQMHDHLLIHIELMQKIIFQNNKTVNEMLLLIPVLITECQKYK